MTDYNQTESFSGDQTAVTIRWYSTHTVPFGFSAVALFKIDMTQEELKKEILVILFKYVLNSYRDDFDFQGAADISLSTVHLTEYDVYEVPEVLVR